MLNSIRVFFLHFISEILRVPTCFSRTRSIKIDVFTKRYNSVCTCYLSTRPGNIAGYTPRRTIIQTRTKFNHTNWDETGEASCCRIFTVRLRINHKHILFTRTRMRIIVFRFIFMRTCIYGFKSWLITSCAHYYYYYYCLQLWKLLYRIGNYLIFHHRFW